MHWLFSGKREEGSVFYLVPPNGCVVPRAAPSIPITRDLSGTIHLRRNRLYIFQGMAFRRRTLWYCKLFRSSLSVEQSVGVEATGVGIGP